MATIDNQKFVERTEQQLKIYNAAQLWVFHYMRSRDKTFTFERFVAEGHAEIFEMMAERILFLEKDHEIENRRKEVCDMVQGSAAAQVWHKTW